MIGSVADFIAHASARGNDAPGDAPASEASAALVRAGDYLRAHYRVAVENEVAELENAAYLVAAVELASPGAMSRTYTSGERKVLSEVKGIKWQIVPGDGRRAYPVLTLVDGLLGPTDAPPAYVV